MKKLIATRQMIIAAVLYCLHRYLCYNNVLYAVSIFRWYFADGLALIVCIPIFVNSQILFKVRGLHRITIIEVILYATLFSVYFEIIGPVFISQFTADIFDMVAYFSGGFILYFSQNMNKTLQKRKIFDIILTKIKNKNGKAALDLAREKEAVDAFWALKPYYK